MGYEKEQQIVREEQARQRAKEEGKVCGVCGAPLIATRERSSGVCGNCDNTMNKDD